MLRLTGIPAAIIAQSALVILLAGLPGGAAETTSSLEQPVIALKLASAAFAKGQAIPAKYTCDGDNVSPPLKWSGAPPETKSFALICDDPDAPAGTWVHWVIYGLPASAAELAENIPNGETMPNGAKQGLNDFKQTGYGGPCPPPGTPHRYFFKLYALDAELPLKPRATKQQLLRAMATHILAQGQLVGTYQRP